MSGITLILGGARSGKSRFAQQLAERLGKESVLFVATAEAGDDEMQDRINHHRNSRPARWRTLEQPLNVGEAIRSGWRGEAVVLVDCLTLLVSNILLLPPSESSAAAVQQRVHDEVHSLLETASQLATKVILVSGEVGLGLVPETPLGRQYRDLLGLANQQVAAAGGPTYLMVAGLPINVRALAAASVEGVEP